MTNKVLCSPETNILVGTDIQKRRPQLSLLTGDRKGQRTVLFFTAKFWAFAAKF